MVTRNPIVVIGGGNSGLAMAAYLKHHGHTVVLWNRTDHVIAALRDEPLLSSGIIHSECGIDVVTSSIEEALSLSDTFLITTPADSHRYLGQIIAPYVRPDMIFILNPGRTFGAHEFMKSLKEAGCEYAPDIAETQTILFTCRKVSNTCVSILAVKNGVKIASLPSNNIRRILNRLPRCLREKYSPVESIIETSIGNVGMILHCAPVLLNCGWIEYPYVDFKYYYDGITKSIAGFLEKLDCERVEVSAHLGNKVENLLMWLQRSYAVTAPNLFECLQLIESYKYIDAPRTLQHRYLFEDVPMGLVPLESVGMQLGLPMSLTSLVINMANAVLETDFRKKGRTVQSLGIDLASFRFHVGKV